MRVSHLTLGSCLALVLSSLEQVSFETWKDVCRMFDLVDVDITERDVTLAFVMARTRIVDEQSDRGRIMLMYMSFEDFIEGLCRLAVRKALPTDDEVAAAGSASAGEHLWRMREESIDAYNDLVTTRARAWGSEPPQYAPPSDPRFAAARRAPTRSVSRTARARS